MADAGIQAPSDRFIEYGLRLTKGRLRLVHVASAVLLMLASAAAILLIMVVGDHLLKGGLPTAMRVAMQVLLLATETGLFVAMILYPLGRRMNDLYIARLIEKAHPEFRNDLTAALQLAHNPNVHPGSLFAVKLRAARDVVGADVENSVATRRVRQCALLLALAAGLLGLYGLVAPKSVLASLARAIGYTSIPVPCRTGFLAIEPAANSVLVEGQPVVFTATIRRPSGSPILRISRNGGQTVLSEDTLTMYSMGPEGNQFAAGWKAAAIGNKAVFTIACGDAVSEPRELTIVAKPVVDVKTSLRWPAYVHRPDETLPTGEVSAIAGTEVTVTATANLPVASASIRFETDPRESAQMAVDNDGRITRSFRIKPRQTDSYHVNFASRYDGITGRSITYQVKADADDPPTIRLLRPTSPLTLSTLDSLSLAAEIQDDFGLAGATLICDDGKTSRQFPLVTLPAPGRRTQDIDQRIAVSQLGHPGQTLTCHIEAVDFCPLPNGTVGQITKSPSFTLSIIAPAQPIAAEPQNSPESIADAEPASPAQSQPATANASRAEDAGPAADSLAEALNNLLAANNLDAKRLTVLSERLDKARDSKTNGADSKIGNDGQDNKNNPADKNAPGQNAAGNKAGASSDKNNPPGDGKPNGSDNPAGNDGQGNKNNTGNNADSDKAGASSDKNSPPGDGKSTDANGQPGNDGQGNKNNQSDKNNSGQNADGDNHAADKRTDGKTPSSQPANSSDSQEADGAGQAEGQQPKSTSASPAGSSGAGDSPSPNSMSGDSGTSGKSPGGTSPGSGSGSSNGAQMSQAGASQSNTPGQGQGSPGGNPSPGQQASGQGGQQSNPGQGGEPSGGSPPSSGQTDLPLAQEPADGAQRKLESIGRALDEAIQEIRDNTVDPSLLADLGMTQQEFKNFVERYAEHFDALRKTDRPAARNNGLGAEFTLPGNADLQTGRTPAGPLKGTTGSERLSEDQIRKLRQSRLADVAPEYRREMDEFFRTLSENAASAQPATAPSR